MRHLIRETSKFSSYVRGFEEILRFSRNEKKKKEKKKVTGHIYLRGQITPRTESKIHDSRSPFCKIHDASHALPLIT